MKKSFITLSPGCILLLPRAVSVSRARLVEPEAGRVGVLVLPRRPGRLGPVGGGLPGVALPSVGPKLEI
jgi:hypothetical protein